MKEALRKEIHQLAAKWRLFVAGIILILAGSLTAHFTQTTRGTRIQDVRFTETTGVQMSALLYIPINATAKTPAPAILDAVRSGKAHVLNASSASGLGKVRSKRPGENQDY